MKIFLYSILILFLYACSSRKEDTNKQVTDSVEVNKGKDQIVCDSLKQYSIPSAIINYQGTSIRNNESIAARWVFYFNQYGINKRMDRYEGKELIESHCTSNHSAYFIINHKTKTYELLESPSMIFNMIIPKDSIAGKKVYKKANNEMVLDKDCEIYLNNQKDFNYKYGFWKNICLLYEFKMTGSLPFSFKSAPIAIKEIEISNQEFEIPAGYKKAQ